MNKTTTTATPANFKFAIRQAVTIKLSKEKGEVRARCEYASGNMSYLVAHTSPTGGFCEMWIDEEMLEAEAAAAE